MSIDRITFNRRRPEPVEFTCAWCGLVLPSYDRVDVGAGKYMHRSCTKAMDQFITPLDDETMQDILDNRGRR